MKKMRCVSIRESKPEQLKEGTLYWMDENTMYADPDGDEYAVVYADANGDVEIGNVLTKHFVPA